MTGISRIQNTIIDHNAFVDYLALCLLVAGCVVGTLAINQTDLTNYYDSLLSSLQVFNKPVATTSVGNVLASTGTSALVVKTAQPDMRSVKISQDSDTDLLQPAPSPQSAKANLQVSTNNIQRTGNFQNATAFLQ